MTADEGSLARPLPIGPFHIIVNPIAGHGKAPEFVNTHVVPLLESLKLPFELHTTQAERDAGRIGREILSQQESEDQSRPITVLIAGGDGTAHELIEGVLEATHKDDNGKLGRWELIILPLGTANALHASLFPPGKELQNALSTEDLKVLKDATPETLHNLSSLLQALSPGASPFRLPVTLTSLVPSPSETTGDSKVPALPIASHIVLSTSLHAALLSDSEALRAEHPGVERFKLAAVKNLPVAFQANATIHGRVLQYSPKSKSFVPPFTAKLSEGCLQLEGPFSYFTSTTTANRFEPTFVIAPTLSLFPPEHQQAPTMDLIVLRPLRDPVVRKALEEGEDKAAEARGNRLGEAMGWAYQDGHHINVTYATDGSGAVEDSGDGEVVVEVFRCEGFDWVPTKPTHAPSHLVCADGSIHTIPLGGRASVGLARPHAAGKDHGFYVWG